MKRVPPTILMIALSLMGPVNARGDDNSGEVIFQRNDKVLSWKTNNSGEFALRENMGLKVDSSLATSLNMTTGKGVRDRWYDTVTNSAELRYDVSDRVGLLFTAREDWNKDTMSRLGNSLFTTDYGGSIRYKPHRTLSLNADVGHIYDKRFEHQDSGAQVSGGIKYLGEPLGNLTFDLDGSGETSNLKRSKDGFRGTGIMSFRHNVGNATVYLTENFSRRGYFSDIDRASIERRKRDERTLALVLSRGDFGDISRSAAVELRVDMGSKIITDSANENKQSSKYQNNARGKEKGFDLRIAKGVGRRMTAKWGVEYNKNSNGVERLSRRRTQTDIATTSGFSFGVGRADTVEVTGWVKRTRIDTPIGVANDRDELKLEGGVLYTRHFTNTFETSLDFRVLETHYVNIDVSQSSQNKWMKTYTFSPSLVYSPLQRLRIEHMVNLYANYITYDFDSDYSPRSNISRRISSESWIDLRLSRTTLVKMGMMFEDNDYGRLNTKRNKLPAEEGLRRFGDIAIEYVFTDWLTLRPNYVYALRRDWEVSEDIKRPIRREVDQTFAMNFHLFRNENGSIAVSVRRIIRKTWKYPIRIRNYITMTLRYGF